MIHPKYGRLAHIYYEKGFGKYRVRFKRRGQFFVSPYYEKVEDAIQARNVMQRIVPPSVSKKYGTKKICDYTFPTWRYEDYLKGIDQPINNKQHIHKMPNSKQGVDRYKNRKEQEAIQNQNR